LGNRGLARIAEPFPVPGFTLDGPQRRKNAEFSGVLRGLTESGNLPVDWLVPPARSHEPIFA